MSRPSLWQTVLMDGWNENPQLKREYRRPLDALWRSGSAQFSGYFRWTAQGPLIVARKAGSQIFIFVRTGISEVLLAYRVPIGAKGPAARPETTKCILPPAPSQSKIHPPTSGLEVGIQPTSNQKLHQQAMAPPFHIHPSPPRDRVRQPFESLRSPPFKGPQAQAGAGLPPGFGQPVVSGNI